MEDVDTATRASKIVIEIRKAGWKNTSFFDFKMDLNIN